MMPLEGDRSRTILAMAVSRVWRDPEYKQRFINDPKQVLSDEGVDFTNNVTVKVVEETPTIKYVDLATAAAGPESLRQFLPIPDGQELRVVQGTDNLSYVVVPPAPAWIAPGAKADDLLIAQQEAQIEVVAETSVETLVVVDQNTEVEVQELVQAQLVTTEIVEFEAQVSIEMAS